MRVNTNIGTNVARILKNSRGARMDDGKLFANYWYHEMIELGFTPEDATRFTQLFAEGKLTHPESIRRRRQKLQEEDPETYGQNKKHRVKEIQSELFDVTSKGI